MGASLKRHSVGSPKTKRSWGPGEWNDIYLKPRLPALYHSIFEPVAALVESEWPLWRVRPRSQLLFQRGRLNGSQLRSEAMASYQSYRVFDVLVS